MIFTGKTPVTVTFTNAMAESPKLLTALNLKVYVPMVKLLMAVLVLAGWAIVN